jgi:hypothetical protein
LDTKANQYTCLWLDSTSGAGLTNNAICKAKPAGETIPFIFTLSSTESIHTTFAYRKETDAWRWTIDDVKGQKAIALRMWCSPGTSDSAFEEL